MLHHKVVILKYNSILSWGESMPSHFEGNMDFLYFSLIFGKFYNFCSLY